MLTACRHYQRGMTKNELLFYFGGVIVQLILPRTLTGMVPELARLEPFTQLQKLPVSFESKFVQV